MNKHEFLLSLKSKLRKLPKDEIDDILTYYSNYIDDSEKNEEETINELGTPSTIASQILADYAINNSNTNKNNKSILYTLILIILAILAAPIGLPLAIILLVAIIVLAILCGTFLIVFIALGFAAFVSGFVLIITGISVIFEGPLTAIYYLGVGFIIIGIGILISICGKNLAPTLSFHTKEFISKTISKINKKKI